MSRETLAFNQEHIQVYVRDIKIDALRKRLSKHLPRHRYRNVADVTRELLIYEPYLTDPSEETTRPHSSPSIDIAPIHYIEARLEQKCQSCSAESNDILKGMTIHHTAAGWCHAGCR